MGKTVLLELQTAREQPPSSLPSDVWQAIFRRMPLAGSTSGQSPSLLAGLCGLGAP